MEVTLAGSGITYEPDDDQLGRVSIELAAMDGEVGYGQLPVPDPSAGISTATGRAARVVEGSTRLIDGFIVDHDRERGPVPAGTAREYVFSVADPNVLLTGFRVIRSRGAETDYARVMAFAAADVPTFDTTWVLNVSTVTMPAKKYSGTGWDELVTDLVEFTGKTLFVHDLAAGGRCLHYHPLTAGHDSDLSIDDAPNPDPPFEVFAPWNPTRTFTSMDLRNDIMGRDQAGRTSTVSDATSISVHDADGLQHQELYDFEAVSQADLNVKTAALLASLKNDTITYRCDIGPLDETALAKIRVGDYIPVTSSVLGLTASPQRISHMTLTPVAPVEGGWSWMAELELGAPIRRRARVKPYIRHVVVSPDTPGVNPPPFSSTCTPMIETFTRTEAVGFGPSEFTGAEWQTISTSGTSSVNGTEGRLEPSPTVSELVDIPLTYPIHMRVLFKIVGATESGEITFWLSGVSNESGSAAPIGAADVGFEYDSGGSPNVFRQDVFFAKSGISVGGTTYPLGVSDPADLLIWTEWIMSATDFQIRTWYDGDPEPPYTLYGTLGTPGIVLPTLVEFLANALGADTPDWRIEKIEFLCEDNPIAGQRVIDEFVGVGDGVRSTWTLKNVYEPGSVLLGLDGIAQPNTISTDPTTGDVTLSFVPEKGETVRAYEYTVGESP